MSKKRVDISVSGRVQGVGFRYFVTQTARSLDLNGTVQNRLDGTVYIRAEGEQENLEQLMVHLKLGPLMARVDDLKSEWSEFKG